MLHPPFILWCPDKSACVSLLGEVVCLCIARVPLMMYLCTCTHVRDLARVNDPSRGVCPRFVEGTTAGMKMCLVGLYIRRRGSHTVLRVFCKWVAANFRPGRSAGRGVTPYIVDLCQSGRCQGFTCSPEM